MSQEVELECQPRDENVLREADGAQAPVQWRSACAPSLGSFFHPSLCHRPCRFIADGVGCPNGAYCEFCHLHGQRGYTPLDKKNRETAKKLGIRLAALLRPTLAERVEEFGLGSSAAAAIEDWSISAAAVWRQSEGTVDDLKPSSIMRLLNHVQTLPLNMVCSIIKNYSGSSDLAGHTKDMLISLRAAARVGQGHGAASMPQSLQRD